jgi:hypothetical protein
MEEMEAGLRQEWEELEIERDRLTDWECHLEDHTRVVSSRTAEERAPLERGIKREKVRRCHTRFIRT